MKLQIIVMDDNDNVLGKRDIDLNGNSKPAAEPEAKMSDAQRRYLFRLLAEMGIEGERAKNTIKEQAEVKDVKEVSKSMASSLIEKYKTQIENWKRDARKEGSHGAPQ